MEFLRRVIVLGDWDTFKSIIQDYDNKLKNDLLLNASYDGLDTMVKILLDYGADIKYRNNLCIKLASINGHDKVVNILREHSLKIDKDIF